MAKAKKQQLQTDLGTTESNTAARTKSGGKGKVVPPAPAPTPDVTPPPAAAAVPVPVPAKRAIPTIDTGLAASTAAKFVTHKDDLATAASALPKGESAAFKEMKENLHKSVGQNTPSVLQNIAPGKKFNNSVPGRNQQIGRNQTFGADVNRTGVPRRTGG